MNRNRLMRNAEAAGRLVLSTTVIIGATTQWAVAFSDAQKSAVAYDNSKVEFCIEPIRQASVLRGGSLRYMNNDLEVYVVGSEDVSREFTRCLNSIQVRRDRLPGQNPQDDLLVTPPELTKVDYGEKPGYRLRLEMMKEKSYSAATRYLYIDQYMKKFLIDLQARQYFELVRIPPQGSIESLGGWDGKITPENKCKNSYGDPCGTKYNILNQ